MQGWLGDADRFWYTCPQHEANTNSEGDIEVAGKVVHVLDSRGSVHGWEAVSEIPIVCKNEITIRIVAPCGVEGHGLVDHRIDRCEGEDGYWRTIHRSHEDGFLSRGIRSAIISDS